MNKKLLAVAVAGVLAAPAAALAQSSVTISGLIKMSVQQYKIGNANTVLRGTGNTSQGLVHDDSSRIIFNVVEDLGGGLQAIAQVDWRVNMDPGTDLINGNNHLGLRSKQWGRIIVGRQDVHYFNRESELTVRNDLQADSISLLAFAGGGGTAIAGATRTPNIVHSTTPNWGGFTGIVAYSFNSPGAVEADINSTTRRGRSWHANPNFAGRNFQVGYSYWSQKADAFAAADQRGDRLYGSYTWSGFKIGVAWDKSKLKNAAGTETSRRTAWSLPLQYEFGPHYIGGHFTKARDDKATVGQDGARMWAVGYAYNLSKRTSLGVTYASIRNDEFAFYTPFTANSGAIGGGAPHGALPGEDPRFWSMTMRHVF
jgi:predicted porin